MAGKEKIKNIDKGTQTTCKRILVKQPRNVDSETQTQKLQQQQQHGVCNKQKHNGMQASAETVTKCVQTDKRKNNESSTETFWICDDDRSSILETSKESQTDFAPIYPTVVNIAIQTNLDDEKSSKRSSVGLQTNLPTEETLRIMNDLKTQKKVNLAIAELCFHLTSKERDDV